MMTSPDTNAQEALERRRAQNRVAQRRFRQKKNQPEPELALWPEIQAGSLHDGSLPVVPGDAVVPSPLPAPRRSAILPSADNAGFFGGLISAFDGPFLPEKGTSSSSTQDVGHSHFSTPSPATSITTTSSYFPSAASTLVSTHSPGNATTASSASSEQNMNASVDEPMSSVTPSSGRCNPLHIAARKGHDQVVQILLRSSKVDCNEEDGDGLTALMHAVISGHAETARSLLLQGASITGNHANGQRRPSALHWAIRYRREDTLRLLLTYCLGDKALIDCFDDVGRTSLHLASELDFGAGAALLLEFGADPCLNTRTRDL